MRNMKMNGKPLRVREGSRVATAALYAAGGILALVTLYPMYYVLILSVSDARAALTMQVYTVPKGFNLDAYRILLKDPRIWRSFLNSIILAVSPMILQVCTSMLSAFPLTFKSMIGRKYVNTYLLITMFFSGGLIPTFLLIMKLGMYNTPWALIIPGAFHVWNIILAKSYLSTIPETLREAAKIDGANVYQMLLRIYFPLATPILAVIAINVAVGYWNGWFSAMVYLRSTDWQPLQLYLRRMLILGVDAARLIDPDAARAMTEMRIGYAQVKYATIIFSSLPILLTFPFFQRYFVRGIVMGSLKE